MKEYNVDCEECENSTIVLTYEEPHFCPLCGRRAEVNERVDEVDWVESE
jgi:rRNA maturation endonuclease Nob1